MYRKHFGLTRFLFSKDPPVTDPFPSASAAEMEARLIHVLDLRGLGLFTAPPGSGKTVVCRKVVSALHPALYRPFYVPNCSGNTLDIYKSIAAEMNLTIQSRRSPLYRGIKAEVSRLCLETKVRPVLVLDDAHFLRNDVLDDLRLLTNYEMDGVDRLCLILVGHPELRRRLAMVAHEALSQRIVVRYHLGALSRAEIEPYLAHLLRLAGTELPLFEPSAVEAIFEASSGLPRKVNLIAHHSLNAAALARAKTVTADHVAAALPETQ